MEQTWPMLLKRACSLPGRLEVLLDSLSVRDVRLLLTASIILISALNWLASGLSVYPGPLYILPVCLACWRLDLQIGLAVAAITALFDIGIYHASRDCTFRYLVIEWLMYAIVLSILACIVSSFRYCFDRQYRVARLDHLTGALNKRAFETQVETILTTSADDHSFLLAFIDLDGFKAVNDHHGHTAGDDVLLRVGCEATTLLRQGDCAGRIGGDEFALLMRLSSASAGHALATSLHSRFTSALADTSYSVTCSMGALVIQGRLRTTVRELMCQADNLMYAAKRSGKNDVKIAGVCWSSGASGQAISESPVNMRSAI